MNKLKYYNYLFYESELNKICSHEKINNEFIK